MMFFTFFLLGGTLRLSANDSLESLMNDYCIFKVSFDKGDVNADIAAGREMGTAKGDNAPAFQDGIRGKALLVNKTSVTEVSYSSSNNFILSKPGAISFWIQPVQWLRGNDLPDLPGGKPGQKIQDGMNFFGTSMGKACFAIKRQTTHDITRGKNDRLLVYSSDFNGIRDIRLWYKDMIWGEGEWHHLVLTWSRTDIVLFIDGKRVGQKAIEKPMEITPDTFTLGSQYGTSILLDEFYIFSKQLTDEEVKLLYTGDICIGDADSQPGKGFSYIAWTPGINYGKNPADFATIIPGKSK